MWPAGLSRATPNWSCYAALRGKKLNQPLTLCWGSPATIAMRGTSATTGPGHQRMKSVQQAAPFPTKHTSTAAQLLPNGLYACEWGWHWQQALQQVQMRAGNHALLIPPPPRLPPARPRAGCVAFRGCTHSSCVAIAFNYPVNEAAAKFILPGACLRACGLHHCALRTCMHCLVSVMQRCGAGFCPRAKANLGLPAHRLCFACEASNHVLTAR